MKTHLTGLAAAAVLALGGLSGCGGDGDVDGAGDSPSAVEENSDGAVEEDGAADGSGDVDRFCGAFRAMIQNGDGGDITLEQGLGQVATLADSAPEEIRADAETANEGYRAITDAVEDAGLELSALDDPTALSPADRKKLAAASAEVEYDWAALNRAFANIEDWVAQNC